MQIVGIEQTDEGAIDVHTIDVWFSDRRQKWVIERLSADGSQIGAAHTCDCDEEVLLCLEEWVRTHDAHLVAPHSTSASERRMLDAAKLRARAA